MEDHIRESKEAPDDNLFQTSYEYEEEIREQGIERGLELGRKEGIEYNIPISVDI